MDTTPLAQAGAPTARPFSPFAWSPEHIDDNGNNTWVRIIPVPAEQPLTGERYAIQVLSRGFYRETEDYPDHYFCELRQYTPSTGWDTLWAADYAWDSEEDPTGTSYNDCSIALVDTDYFLAHAPVGNNGWERTAGDDPEEARYRSRHQLSEEDEDDDTGSDA